MVTTLLVIVALILAIRRDRVLDANVLSEHQTSLQIS